MLQAFAFIAQRALCAKGLGELLKRVSQSSSDNFFFMTNTSLRSRDVRHQETPDGWMNFVSFTFLSVLSIHITSIN